MQSEINAFRQQVREAAKLGPPDNELTMLIRMDVACIALQAATDHMHHEEATARDIRETPRMRSLLACTRGIEELRIKLPNTYNDRSLK